MYKKIILGLAIISGISLAAFELNARPRGGNCGQGYGPGAGYGQGRGMGAGFGRIDVMKQQLGLSDKQVDQIFKLGQEHREKMFQNRADYSKMQTLRDEHRKAVEGVLTKEQKEKWNNGPAYGPGYGRGRGNGPRW